MLARTARALDSSAVIPAGRHLFPFRTEKLSLPGPMVLGGQPPGRVGRRRFLLRREPRERLFLVVDAAASVRRRPSLAAAPRFAARRDRASRSRRTRSATGGWVTKSAARPRSRNGLIVNSGSVAGLPAKSTSSAACSRRDQRVGEPVRRVAELRREAVGRRTPASARRAGGRTPRRPGRARRGARARGSRRSGSPRASSAASTAAAVCTWTSCRRTCASSCARTPSSSAGVHAATQAGADGERRAARAAPGGERARQAVGDQIEPRLRDAGERGEPLDRRVEQRRLRERQLARADHPEHHPVERSSTRRRRAGARRRRRSRAAGRRRAPSPRTRTRRATPAGEAARP